MKAATEPTASNARKVFNPSRTGVGGPTPAEAAALKAQLARSEKWKQD